MSLKKILIIIITILLLVLVFLLYNIWKEMRGEETPEPTITKPPITGAIVPIIQKQKLTQLTNRPIIGLTIANQKLKYFDKLTGHIYEMALDGTREREIIKSDIPDLISASWNKTGDKAIIKMLEKQYFYDFNTNQVLLVDFQNPIWCENKIVYLCNQGICQSDGDGGKEKLIFKTQLRNLNLVCFDKNIYFYQKPSAKAPSVVYLINNNQINKVLGPEYGLIFKSPDLYSIGIKPYNTIADKCINNYCAVPQNLPNNALMPDDYYKNLFKTQDSIWQVKPIKKEIIKTSHDIQNLLIFENKLYFTDKVTNYLYLIKLTE